MEVGRKNSACCGRAVIPAFVLSLLSCCVLEKMPQLSRSIARCDSVEIDLASSSVQNGRSLLACHMSTPSRPFPSGYYFRSNLKIHGSNVCLFIFAPRPSDFVNTVLSRWLIPKSEHGILIASLLSCVSEHDQCNDSSTQPARPDWCFHQHYSGQASYPSIHLRIPEQHWPTSYRLPADHTTEGQDNAGEDRLFVHHPEDID